MKNKLPIFFAAAAISFVCGGTALADPIVSRLTPPSLLFSTGVDGAPYVSRFLPGQRFDLQATIKPDAGQAITGATFSVDGRPVERVVTVASCDAPGLPANTVAVTLRAYSAATPGVHVLSVRALQSDGKQVTATGEFEVIALSHGGKKVKNVILMIGDGMGIAHRTAARILYKGMAQGKALDSLEMDTMESVALVKTASLNSIITDSAPGAACYSTGNKSNNNQQGVFPDDTVAKFDNPRVELISEYLARTEGKALGIVTTADVFDATPAAFGSHTQDRGAGTGSAMATWTSRRSSPIFGCSWAADANGSCRVRRLALAGPRPPTVYYRSSWRLHGKSARAPSIRPEIFWQTSKPLGSRTHQPSQPFKA